MQLVLKISSFILWIFPLQRSLLAKKFPALSTLLLPLFTESIFPAKILYFSQYILLCRILFPPVYSFYNDTSSLHRIFVLLYPILYVTYYYFCRSSAKYVYLIECILFLFNVFSDRRLIILTNIFLKHIFPLLRNFQF